ncbi:RHS repeat domain-containing protein [Dyella tabacisoli]|uniref:RHS repeat-associated core domain-containing protein n=1 Tax=Dyella tabacisoli TaxID=2282381 RepID=A0A369UTF0_9GAMM|nr:RHS repeat-associated core domain-containing protein [Dyella tabacisoli]RDD82880.1 RHS repeat-associated core domain-containing protein [Dyella tabacisoli]
MKILKNLLVLTVLWLAANVAAYAGTTVTYIYTDPQGTPLAEADASGNITATFDYRPYGTQALGNAPNGPGYTSHVNDPDTGLVYMQARYYDPMVGRFVSLDPVGFGSGDVFGFSRFAYAENNPVMRIDPDGRKSEDCSFACRWMRKVSDSFSGIGREIMQKIGGGGPRGQLKAANAIANFAAADGMQEVSEATDPAIKAIPGGAVAICATDGCSNFEWSMAVVAGIPGEGLGENIAIKGVEEGGVQFGKVANQIAHTFRHVGKIGLDSQLVQNAIKEDLSKVASSLSAGQHNGSVIVNGVKLDYSAFKLPDGTINVGRITPPRP